MTLEVDFLFLQATQVLKPLLLHNGAKFSLQLLILFFRPKKSDWLKFGVHSLRITKRCMYIFWLKSL